MGGVAGQGGLREHGGDQAGGDRDHAGAIFFFARVIRCAIVVSGTRNACAISGTVSPPRSRSVSAIRASGASAGWQQVNRSRSRSSSDRSGVLAGRVVVVHEGRLVLRVALLLAADPVVAQCPRWW